MAAYSSVRTGNWTDSSTWNPSGIPGIGDTVTINSGHTVTIPSSVDIIVGTDTGDAITINASGILSVSNGASLFSRGNIVMNGTTSEYPHLIVNGSLDILEGFSIRTSAGGNPKKVTFINAIIRAVDINRNLKVTGNNTRIGSSNSEWWFEIRNSQILGFGNGSSTYALQVGSISNSAGYYIIKNTLFKIYGRMIIRSAPTFDFSNNDIRAINSEFVEYSGAGKTISECTFYGAQLWTGSNNTPAWTIYRCIFVQARITARNSIITECGFWLFNSSDIINSLSSGTVNRCLSWMHQPNPHFFSCGSSGVISTVRDCVFDGDGYYSSDYGDCVLISAGISGARSRVNVEGCININSAGALVTMLNNYSECEVKHCTVYGLSFNNIDRLSACSIGETNGTDQHFTMKDSLFVYGVFGARKLSAYQSNTIEYCDYIAHYGLSGSRIPNGTGNSPLQYNSFPDWRTSSPVDSEYGLYTGWGANDKPNTPPLFVDPSRRVAAYKNVNTESGMVESSNNTSNNPGYIVGLRCLYRNGYDENGNPVTWNPDYSPEKILDWIREGFRPQNIALKGAASDGGDIGAMPVYIPVYTTGRMPKVVIVGG